MNNIKILKFGGIVLSSIEGFKNMLNIIKSYDNTKIMLVISAIAKSTRQLHSSGILASKGKLVDAEHLINSLCDEYITIVHKLIEKKDYIQESINEINIAKNEIYLLLKGIYITKECTYRTLDLLMSYGEKITLLIAYKYLKVNNISIKSVDSTAIIKTNSNFGSATPNLETTNKNITNSVLPLFDNYQVVITQGFVASDFSNQITTMGIESSNLSAAIYSKFLNCNEIIIFTDVDGIRNCDPKLNTSTELIPYLSYKQAYQIGLNGLKLIYPKMISLAKKANIKIRIKSGLNNSNNETIISNTENKNPLEITINNGIKYLLKINIHNSKADYFNNVFINANYKNNKYNILPSKINKIIANKLSKSNVANINYKVLAFENSFCIIEFPILYPNIESKECEKITKVLFNFNDYNILQLGNIPKNSIFFYNFNGIEQNIYKIK